MPRAVSTDWEPWLSGRYLPAQRMTASYQNLCRCRVTGICCITDSRLMKSRVTPYSFWAVTSLRTAPLRFHSPYSAISDLSPFIADAHAAKDSAHALGDPATTRHRYARGPYEICRANVADICEFVGVWCQDIRLDNRGEDRITPKPKDRRESCASPSDHRREISRLRALTAEGDVVAATAGLFKARHTSGTDRGSCTVLQSCPIPTRQSNPVWSSRAKD